MIYQFSALPRRNSSNAATVKRDVFTLVYCFQSELNVPDNRGVSVTIVSAIIRKYTTLNITSFLSQMVPFGFVLFHVRPKKNYSRLDTSSEICQKSPQVL